LRSTGIFIEAILASDSIADAVLRNNRILAAVAGNTASLDQIAIMKAAREALLPNS
jgi:hypothetical protein